MEIVKMIEWILEGLLGTAALLILPTIILVAAEIYERRTNKTQPSATELLIENQLLDTLHDRLKK